METSLASANGCLFSWDIIKQATAYMNTKVYSNVQNVCVFGGRKLFGQS